MAMTDGRAEAYRKWLYWWADGHAGPANEVALAIRHVADELVANVNPERLPETPAHLFTGWWLLDRMKRDRTEGTRVCDTLDALVRVTQRERALVDGSDVVPTLPEEVERELHANAWRRVRAAASILRFLGDPTENVLLEMHQRELGGPEQPQ